MTNSKLLQIWKNTFRIPKSMPVDEWASSIGIVSPPDSPISGTEFNPNYVPYYKQIYADVIDPNVKYITNIKAAQVGYTFYMNNIALYFCSHEKKNVYVVYPNDVSARKYSDNKLQPFIRAQVNYNVDAIAKFYNDRSSAKFNQIFGIHSIRITGANKGTAFTSDSYPVVILDEMSNIPVNVAGDLGDPISLAEGRTKAFSNMAKIISGGTLILEGGILEREFSMSQQNYWHMPCPKCGFMQPFLFRDIDDETFRYVTYQVDPLGMAIPGSEFIICRNPDCEHRINESERLGMIRHPEAKWVPLANPEVINRKGYFINSLMSPFETLENICQAHSKAVSSNDPNILRTFINDYEARAWKYKDVDIQNIDKNMVVSEFEIPPDVAFLTMGIDVQRGSEDEKNRIEYEIVGWGKNRQTWGIAYGKIYGDLRTEEIWQKLAYEIHKPRYTDLNIDPNPFFVDVAFIDVQGNDEENIDFFPDVMNACHSTYTLHYPNFEHNYIFQDTYIPLFPVRGLGGSSSADAPLLKFWTENDVHHRAIDEQINTEWFRKVNMVNTHKFKEQIFADLASKKSTDKDGNPTIGFSRFVMWNKEADQCGYTKTYFKGLQSEKKFFSIKKSGRMNVNFKKVGVRRNEPLDLRVYNYAAAQFFSRSVPETHLRFHKISSVFII